MFLIFRERILSLFLVLILSLLMLLVSSTILCKQGPRTLTRSKTMTKHQSRGFSCSIIQFCSIIVYTLTCTLSFQGTFSLMDEHLPFLAAKLSAMVAVSLSPPCSLPLPSSSPKSHEQPPPTA